MEKKILLPLIALLLFSLSSNSQTYFTEDFESAFTGSPAVPSGWSRTSFDAVGGAFTTGTTSSGNKEWIRRTWSGTAWSPYQVGTVPSGAVSGTGVLSMEDYWYISSGNRAKRIESPAINLSSATSPFLSFWLFCAETPWLNANMKLQMSNDGGTTWHLVSPILVGFDSSAANQWNRIRVRVPDDFKTSNFKFAFEVTSLFNNHDYYIDLVEVLEFTPVTITSTGTGNWNAAATWDLGRVPRSGDNVVVASGHTVTINNGTVVGLGARCNNLTVNGTLTFSTTTSTSLHVFGNLSIAGTFNAFNGTSGRLVVLNGNLSISSGGTYDHSVGTTSLTATTTFSTGTSILLIGGYGNTSFSNSGTLVNGRIQNLVLLKGNGTFTFNNAVTIPRTIVLGNGVLNTANVTAGNSSISTTQIIARARGSVSGGPFTWGSGVTRTYSFISPHYALLRQETISTGDEIEKVGGIATVNAGGTFQMATHNNVQLTEDVQLGTGTSTAATLTLTRGIIITGSNKLIWNTTSATGPGAATTPSTASPPTTHGSYVVGNFKMLFQTSGTASRIAPLGIGTSFNDTVNVSANRATPITFGNTTGWSASNPYPIISWAGAPSGATNTPLTTLFTARALRVNLDGGNDFNANTTIALNANNYTFGGGSSSDSLIAGDVAQLRLAQSTSLAGSWNARTNSSGSGAFVSNTNYSRTTATASPGPIAPLATNGEYFAWASTVPNLDVQATALVSPASVGCYGVNQTVTVTLRNNSGSTLNFATDPVTVGALVQGPIPASPFTVLNTGTLAAGASTNITVTTTLDMSANGTYIFTPYAKVTGDGNTANDSLSPKPTRTKNPTVSLPTTLLTFTGYTGANLPSVFPQWFEGGTGFTPAGSETSSPWTSDVFGNTGSNTAIRLNIFSTSRILSSGWIVGPKFTATSCTKLKYDLALTTYNTTTASSLDADDTLGVYVSTDCGASWTLVKLYTQGSSISNTGQTETVNLGAYSGQEIIVAFYGTEGPTATGDDDLFLDNIQILDATGVDIAAEAIVAPTPSGTTPNGNPAQQITVRIRNNSCNTHNFSANPTTITINVTGAGTATRNVTLNSGTLAADDTLWVNVGATFSMSTLGTYNFAGTAITTGDVLASNDTFPASTHDVTQGWNIRYATGATFPSIMTSGTAFTNWTVTTGTFISDDNTSGTVRLFNLVPPFDFQFYGTTVAGFRACTNGWITFDTLTTSTAFSNDLASGTITRILAPFWDDLRANGNPNTLTSLDTTMRYQVIGNAPDRVLVVEWKGMESFSNPNGTDLNFQIRMYENGDSIEYWYNRMQGFDGSTNFTWSYSLGLKGTNTNAQRQSQAVANSRQFGATAVNNLSEVPACNSKLSFIPFDNCVGCTASTAPPSNDSAGAAITIPVNTDPCVDLCGTYYRSRFATTSPQAVCTGTADDDVWFKFTAPNPLLGNIKIDVRGAGGYDPVLEILDASFTSMRCRDATGVGLTDTAVVLESNLIPGATYYARVYHAGSGSGTDGNFSICAYNQPLPPVNDTVAGAINLTIGTSCSPISGNTLAATGSKNPSCSGVADDDLWYRFTATSSNIVIEVQSGTGFNAVLQVFDSISSPLSAGDTIARPSLACVNATSTGGLETFNSSSLVPGRTYYVRVYHQPGGAGSGSFTICAYTPPRALGTITATQQTGDVAQGASNQPVVGYNLPVTGFSGTLTLTNAVVTSNNTLDSDISAGGVMLYSTGSTATFTSPVLLGSASFSGGTATFSSLSLNLATGNNYLWIAYNISPTAIDGDSVDAFLAAGSLTISASGGAVAPGSQPPVNLNPVGRRRIFIPNPHDDCSGAKPLTICAAPDTIKNLHRTTNSLPTTCGGTPDDDVWYSFTPTTSDTLFIVVYSTVDVVLDVREGSACNGTSIGCVDANFSSGYEEGILTGVTPGTTYFLRIYSWSSVKPSPTAFHWAAVAPAGCWIGDISTAWGSAGNWSNGVVPNSCAQNVQIPSGTPFAPTISGVSYTCGNINIAGGVNLTLSGQNLSVCGNWTGGTSTAANVAGSGHVRLLGTGTQSVSGRTTFNTLRVDKTSGTSGLGSGAIVDINTALELRNGDLNVSSGTLTLKSPDSSFAAIIDNFSPGFSGTLTGNITAERGYGSALAVQLHKQHYFGTPFINLPIAQFAPPAGTNGVAVTPKPDCDELSTAPSSNYGNVFEYDESIVSSCHLEGWMVRSSGNTDAGRGYSVVKNGSGVLSQTGLPRTSGNVLRSGLTNSGWTSGPTPQGNTYFSGWHLLGNPYPASVDLSYSGTNTAFDDEVLVMHTGGPLAGTLQPLSMSGTGILPPFQGFLARKSLIGGTATFTFNASDRRTAQTAFQKNEWKRQMSLQVAGNGFSDVTYFNFIADATDSYDPAYDGAKIPSRAGQPTIYSLIGSEWASVNSQPSVETVQPIPVGFVPGGDGTFLIEAQGFEELENTTVFLEDKKENIMHNLTQTPDYIFTASKADQRERFVLHFNYQQPSGLTNNGNPSSNIRLFPNPASSLVYVESQEPTAKNQELNVEVFDINGRRVNATFKPATSGAGTLDVSMLPSAVYQVRITGAGGNVVKRLVKE